jgi:hypothetical protein
MARLPVPGSDADSWGDLLNDYLLQAHTSTGALKPDSVGSSQLQADAVTSANIADDSIAQSKVQDLVSDLAATEKTANTGAANGYAPLDGSGKVPDANLPVGSVPSDATTISKGVVQLAGDLGGTAAAPTVPGLADKAADIAVVHIAGTETVTGDKNFTGALQHSGNAVVNTTDSRLTNARTPTAHKTSHATGGTDVLLPSDIGAVAMAGANIATLADSSIQFLRVNVPDDGSSTATWPDRLAFFFDGTRTGYHNEYGELRARPGKSNTIALRAMGWSGGSSNDIFQVTAADSSTVHFAVSETDITANVPIVSPNLPAKITVSDTAPSSPADGDIWFDTSGA